MLLHLQNICKVALFVFVNIITCFYNKQCTSLPPSLACLSQRNLWEDVSTGRLCFPVLHTTHKQFVIFQKSKSDSWFKQFKLILENPLIYHTQNNRTACPFHVHAFAPCVSRVYSKICGWQNRTRKQNSVSLGLWFYYLSYMLPMSPLIYL